MFKVIISILFAILYYTSAFTIQYQDKTYFKNTNNVGFNWTNDPVKIEIVRGNVDVIPEVVDDKK